MLHKLQSTLIFVVLLEISFCNGVEKSVTIDKFYGTCPGYNNLPIQYQDLKILRTDNGEVFMNTSILVKSDVDKPLKMELNVFRCEKSDHNKCTTLRSIKNPNYCAAVLDKTGALYQFFQAIRPKWNCPLKKGTYTASRASLDVSLMKLMKVEDFYWRVRSLVMEQATGKPVLCIQGEGHVDVINN